MTPENFEERLASLERRIAALEDRIRMDMDRQEVPQKQYSPEVILRFRELEQAGNFSRAIVGSVPTGPEYDEATFDCGHKVEVSRILLALMVGKNQHCKHCAKEWLAQQQEGGK
jgi:hypothetical protein